MSRPPRAPSGGAPPESATLPDGSSLELVPLAREIARRHRLEFPDEVDRYGDTRTRVVRIRQPVDPLVVDHGRRRMGRLPRSAPLARGHTPDPWLPRPTARSRPRNSRGRDRGRTHLGIGSSPQHPPLRRRRSQSTLAQAALASAALLGLWDGVAGVKGARTRTSSRTDPGLVLRTVSHARVLRTLSRPADITSAEQRPAAIAA